MSTQEPITIKQHVELIERAIDVATSKGAYNKMDIINIVDSLRNIYSYIEKHESTAVQYKGVPQHELNGNRAEPRNYGSATDPH